MNEPTREAASKRIPEDWEAGLTEAEARFLDTLPERYWTCFRVEATHQQKVECLQHVMELVHFESQFRKDPKNKGKSELQIAKALADHSRAGLQRIGMGEDNPQPDLF